MKFTCERCSAQYMISDEKVSPSGVKVRCKKCGNVIAVRKAAEERVAVGVAEMAGVGGGGLDVELGNAFDHAFGDAPERAPSKAADLASTQALGADDAAKIATAAEPPSTEWYVAIGQAQVGPLPLAEVKRKWEAGDVGPDSLVWHPGMSDWKPLTTVGDLAGYLAPVPQGASRGVRAANEPKVGAVAARANEPAPIAAASFPSNVSWKPAGASALASLASEEMASRVEPTPARSEARAASGGVRSLVDAMNLPDSGGVDPTGAIPLPIKGLEPTDEKKLERRSSVARGAEEARHRRNMSRMLVVGLTAVVLIVGAAAASVVYFNSFNLRPAAAPAVAAVPAAAPPEQVAAPTPPPAAAPPSTAVPLPPPPQAAIASAPAKPGPDASTAAEPKPAAEPPVTTAKAASAEPARTARVERPVRREPPARREPPPTPTETRVAQATAPTTPAPTPTPAPTKRRSESVLDFESNDAALDEALGSGTKASTRSVYVPPRPGGDLPAKLSSAQINEAVAGRMDELRRCMSEQKTREPDATGVLRMRWVIAGDGSVREVNTLTPEHAGFGQCIGGVIKATPFPRSATTGQEVTFPFKF
jgi:predicted Zn finger-like uncharacterized protein